MKIPCEVVVWNVLPMIRRELANELVTTYGVSQAEVARKFEVTDAAISQYLKKKRGDGGAIEKSPLFEKFLEEIKISAKAIATDNKDISPELCRLCLAAKRIGLLEEIYMMQSGAKKMPDCNMEWTSARKAGSNQM